MMHLQRLYLGLKHFGIFFNIACLLGHLMRGFKVADMTGSQLLKIFDTSHSVTLNLKAISLLLSPNLSFIRVTNRWSSRLIEPRTTSTLPLSFWINHSKMTLVRPVKNRTCTALLLIELKENCVFLSVSFSSSFSDFSLLISERRLTHSAESWLYLSFSSSWRTLGTVASEIDRVDCCWLLKDAQ